MADCLYYLLRGRVKLTVSSHQGKEAVAGLCGAGDFFGEGCLAGQDTRTSTAVAMGDCAVLEIARKTMSCALQQHPALASLFVRYLLMRNIQIRDDLVDQLFNSSEKRLARVLILLSRIGKSDNDEAVVPKITHETLAEIVGTTRARITFFMNKFRRQGLIDYNGELRIRSSLMRTVLRNR